LFEFWYVAEREGFARQTYGMFEISEEDQDTWHLDLIRHMKACTPYVGVDRARRLHPTFDSINKVEKHPDTSGLQSNVGRFVESESATIQTALFP
jgi:hypothetical protein